MINEEFMMKCTDCANLKNVSTTYSTDSYWTQSMCYIPTENALVRCLGKIGTSSCFIEKINYSDMSRISINKDLNYAHANDITYNPKTNKLYLTPMFSQESGLDRNLIYVLNASTFVKEAEIHVGTDMSMPVYGIAYNNTDNQYYVALGDSMIVALNNSFEIVSTFSFKQYGITSSCGPFQCIEYFDDKIFVLYHKKIVVFDTKGNYLSNVSVGDSIESEGIASIGNGDFVIGKVYGNNVGLIINEIFSFNIFDCRNLDDMLSTEVGVILKGSVKILNDMNIIRKKGNLVECSLCFTNITSVGGDVIAVIPKAYAPNCYMRVIGACTGTNFARFEIGKDGTIRIFTTTITSIQSNYWFELHITYMVD